MLLQHVQRIVFFSSSDLGHIVPLCCIHSNNTGFALLRLAIRMLDPRAEEVVPAWIKRFRRFDIFPKYDADIVIRTKAGGLVTLIAILFGVFLFISETYDYLKVQREDSLVVDTSRVDTMTVYIDILFPGLPCRDLTVDIVDENGEELPNVDVDLRKTRIDNKGQEIETRNTGLGGEDRCMRCAISEGVLRFASLLDRTKCCTCDDVKRYYSQRGRDPNKANLHTLCLSANARSAALPGEGCEIKGYMWLPRAKGNFHVAAGHSASQAHGGHKHHVHQIIPTKIPEMAEKFRVQHIIKSLRFGDSFPGMEHPLEGVSVYTPGLLRHVYDIKLIPTMVEGRIRNWHTYQYTYSNHTEKVDVTSRHWHLPGVFFRYDFSPMMAVVRFSPRSFIEYLTRLCALIGGTYVVLGMVYKLIAHMTRTVKKRE